MFTKSTDAREKKTQALPPHLLDPSSSSRGRALGHPPFFSVSFFSQKFEGAALCGRPYSCWVLLLSLSPATRTWAYVSSCLSPEEVGLLSGCLAGPVAPAMLCPHPPNITFSPCRKYATALDYKQHEATTPLAPLVSTCRLSHFPLRLSLPFPTKKPRHHRMNKPTAWGDDGRPQTGRRKSIRRSPSSPAGRMGRRSLTSRRVMSNQACSRPVRVLFCLLQRSRPFFLTRARFQQDCVSCKMCVLTSVGL